MKRISNFKIKNKLIAIILLVTVFILMIAFSSIIIFEKTTGLNSLKDQLKATAEIFANNLEAALDFNAGKKQIEKELQVLKNFPVIKNCFVFNETDGLVASYTQLNSDKIPPPIINGTDKKKPSFTDTGKFIYFSQPIISDAEYIGRLYLRASTEMLDQQIQDLIYFMLSLILILIVLSVILAHKLQGIISKPVLNLVDVSREVSAEGDYSIRVLKKYNDEIGMLYDAFNDMMEQILNRNEERDMVVEQLKSAEFLLSSVIESMPTLLVIINKEGEITRWNNTATVITGLTVDEVLGKNLWQLLPDFIDFKAAISDISNSEDSLEFYKKLFHIKGNTFYFNGSIFPLFDGGGTDPRFVIMLNNVTEIEIKERQLRQSQKMETVGNLAGGLAHDFNNVLGGIIGTISLFKYKSYKNKELTSKEIEKYFTTMEESANRASDMVQHLLSLTRKQEFSFTPTDLNDTIRSIVTICKNTFDRSVEINTDYFRDRAMTYADPTQIEQSLLNLCINASHAMTIMRQDSEKYGGSLNVSLRKMNVDKYFLDLHSEAVEAEYWDISVNDTGVGMDSKIVSKIFDPFFTTKRNGTGTGLGLSMVYNIVKQHKGFIDVFSQEDIGTTFHIYLPILKGELSKKEVKMEEEIPRGDDLILVVEDEEVMRHTAKSILMECGYRVLMAENGEEAVEIFKKNKDKIKLVLLDMVMPKMSGKQAYIEMAKIDKDIKVLLVSGFKQDERVESILKLGVKGFVQKPYTMLTLANRIHQLLKES